MDYYYILASAINNPPMLKLGITKRHPIYRIKTHICSFAAYELKYLLKVEKVHIYDLERYILAKTINFSYNPEFINNECRYAIQSATVLDMAINYINKKHISYEIVNLESMRCLADLLNIIQDHRVETDPDYPEGDPSTPDGPYFDNKEELNNYIKNGIIPFEPRKDTLQPVEPRAAGDWKGRPLQPRRDHANPANEPEGDPSTPETLENSDVAVQEPANEPEGDPSTPETLENANEPDNEALIADTCETQLPKCLRLWLEPYQYQLEILAKLDAWYAGQEIAGKLILPPGIGKSYITSFWLRKLPVEYKVLVLVPLIVITEDFRMALERCGVKCLVDILVYNNPRKNVEGLAYDVVIYDEAHHMCSGENSKLLDIPSKKKLFLTATEKMIDDDDQKTFDMNDPLFGKYIYRMTIKEAIDNNLLTDYVFYLAYWKDGLKSVIAQLKTEYNRKKIIMFFNKVEHAKQICSSMNKMGYSANVISAETPSEKRREIINNFSSIDDLQILCNVYSIGEGVNIPCIDTVIFMEYRGSNIGIIQNIGRGLRLYPGKDKCMVLIQENMLKHKFIENLCVYDQRMSKPLSRITADPRLANSPDIKYSIEGIVNIVQLFLNKQIDELNKFIKLLISNGIYSKTDYENRPDSLSHCPDMPDVEYPPFEWSMLLKCYKPYDYEECIAHIMYLAPIEASRLARIGPKKDKLIHLFKIDNRIDPELIDQIKEDGRVSKWFNSSITRSIIK